MNGNTSEILTKLCNVHMKKMVGFEMSYRFIYRGVGMRCVGGSGPVPGGLILC